MSKASVSTQKVILCIWRMSLTSAGYILHYINIKIITRQNSSADTQKVQRGLHALTHILFSIFQESDSVYVTDLQGVLTKFH